VDNKNSTPSQSNLGGFFVPGAPLLVIQFEKFAEIIGQESINGT